MTVKELIEILQTCNETATVIIQEEDRSPSDIHDSQIWATPDGTTVIIDPSYGEER